MMKSDVSSEVLDAYNAWAKNYDSVDNKTRDLDSIIVDHYLNIFKGEKVLELGCGTGKNTLKIAEIAETVTAVDFSPEMLSTAERKLDRFSNVKFMCADFCDHGISLGLAHSACTINLVLEHIETLENVFAVCAKSISAGGKLLISELHPFRQYVGVKAKFSDKGVERKIPAFVHHVSDYLAAAESNNFRLLEFREWFHQSDKESIPRIISILFETPADK